MELTNKTKKKIKVTITIIFAIYVFCLCFVWAKNIPFNNAPDEKMKYDVCEYICNNLKLPHGGDESIRDPIWGISYAFTPILSYIFSGIFMRIAMHFTQSAFEIVLAARFVSILCMVGYVIINAKIGDKLFKGAYKWLYVALVTFLPQVVFLGSYLNNDSLALLSISIIVYSWIIGLEKDWNWKSCILMAVGIGICALSYYNAYGYILCSIFIYCISSYIKKINIKEFLKKGVVIALIAFVLAGWWFVRNFILYDGDFIGLNVSREYGEQYALDEYKPSNRKTPAHENMSLKYMLIDKEWIKSTIQGFIGKFGYMDITMDKLFYNGYKTVGVIGLIGAIGGFIISKIISLIRNIKEKTERKFADEEKIKIKEKILFTILMIICIIIPIILSIYYSYFSDFQPQGRYIMPIIIPLMYFITKGIKNILNFIIKNEKIQNILIGIITIIWSIIPIIVFIKYIKP